jgi:hypothetical protein
MMMELPASTLDESAELLPPWTLAHCEIVIILILFCEEK